MFWNAPSCFAPASALNSSIFPRPFVSERPRPVFAKLPALQEASGVSNAQPGAERRTNRIGRRATDLEFGSDIATLTAARERAEAAFISRVLRRNNNNRQKTAADLGISRMTLYKKLYRYGLVTPGSEGTWPASEEATANCRFTRRHTD
ncbi:MAG: helix-turn-helix domain-containing protein [Hyphomicrobium sp.]|uniref:helix-turn-helix domain-containing protein n=1 Tax=Hyphomicrobium sp. TaxID=82 RepID=UPI0039E6DFFD